MALTDAVARQARTTGKTYTLNDSDGLSLFVTGIPARKKCSACCYAPNGAKWLSCASIKQTDPLLQVIPVVLSTTLKRNGAMAGQDKDKVPDWKALVQLVAMIQRQLSPDAVVQHNVMLDGVQSETKRQVDVLGCRALGNTMSELQINTGTVSSHPSELLVSHF
ncbi:MULTISPECIES: hypothetical protein [unclassified Brenneria]|uniref:hypothetical protein n=1 Tax=unclassified Brenneria TaxID=2634434 RepID=UPI001C13297F|nr:hypothetical protein [Brenneria sp. hezel4-2-4]MEE3652717.1 hypothetical protein [Brenneria sp. HEZEL_4_2_4]